MFFENFWMKKNTPKTVEAVVEHFKHKVIPRNPPIKDAYLSLRKRNLLSKSESLAFRRIIASTYGISEEYDLPDGSKSTLGWNKKLLSDCGTSDPDEAVLIIANKILDSLENEGK